MKLLRKIFKVLGLTVLSIFFLLAVYILTEFTLSAILVKAEPITSENTISMYLITNGVHTDLVVPSKSPYKDWTQEFHFANTKNTDSTFQWLALGWGDKGFYLETPTWAELKPSVAFKAAFGLSTTAIHATYYKSMMVGQDCRELNVTPSQYQRFIDYVESSMQHDQENKIIVVSTNAVYGDNDAFYEANGAYSMLHTCNTWTNTGLKKLGQNACFWAALDKPIMKKHPLQDDPKNQSK